MDDDLEAQRRSRSMLCHRLPSLATAVLSSAALGLSFVAGFSCSFLDVQSSMTLDASSSLGVFCSGDASSSGSELTDGGGGGSGSDTMTTLSKAFLASSWALSIPCVILAWTLALLIPPTDATWRTTSVLAGLASILSIPAFLLLESDVCNDADAGSSCAMSSGAYYLIASASCHALASALPAITSPPTWYEVKENWTIGQEGGIVHGTAMTVRGGITGACRMVQSATTGRGGKYGKGLRYVETESTNGGHDGGPVAGLVEEDDDARDVDYDARDLDASLEAAELGEFTGLTIQYSHDSASEQFPATYPPIPAPAPVLNSNADGKEEGGGKDIVATKSPPLHTNDYLAEPSGDEASSYDQESSYVDTTDDEASRMAQLQTSHLDGPYDDGEVNVIYKERPPAYDLDSPHHIEAEKEKERARKEEQQYWADQEALASDSDVESDRRLVSSASSGDDSDSDAEEAVVASSNNATEPEQDRDPTAAPSNSKTKLLENSRKLRSSLRVLGRKISEGVEDGKEISRKDNTKTKGAYLAMDDSSEDHNSKASRVSSNGISDTNETDDDVRTEGGISFVRVDSNVSFQSLKSFHSIPGELVTDKVDDPSSRQLPQPPGDGYADPPVEYYPSSSEAEVESDIDLEESLVDMVPDDELMSDRESSNSSVSGSSYSSYTTASGNEADDSSLSSYAASDDEKDIGAIVAGLLEEEEKKKKDRKSKKKARDERGRRRRRKKKRKKRSRYYSGASSIGSRSLLDETIAEETDMDLKEMEDSSEGKDSANNRARVSNNNGIGTDVLVAGTEVIPEDAILNTVVKTSFSKEYERGYLSRSPAASDSEGGPLSVLRNVVTPSPRKPQRREKTYHDMQDTGSGYYSSPETNVAGEGTLPPLPEAKDYMSDNQDDRTRGRHQHYSYKLEDVATHSLQERAAALAISDVSGDEADAPVLPTSRRGRQQSSTNSRERSLSLPPVLHERSSRHAKSHWDESEDDDRSLQGSVSSALYRYEMPTTWSKEKSLRSPLHYIEPYFSDSGSNTDSSGGHSMRSSASRLARKARKRRLSLQQMGDTTTSRPGTSASVVSTGIGRVRSLISESTEMNSASSVVSSTEDRLEKEPVMIYDRSII